MNKNQQHRARAATIFMALIALFAVVTYMSVTQSALASNSANLNRSLAPARETETEHPRETETEHPHETETEHPRETETRHPEVTTTRTAQPIGTRTAQSTQTARPSTTSQVPGSGSRIFPQTGKTVSGIFLQYWDNHGGLAQQGYPISSQMQEVSDLNGRMYTVQYFERAVFEYHPENAAPFNVLLSQLGTFRYKARYSTGAPGQKANNTAGSALFTETGKRVGGKFLDYWRSHGGLAQQGYPISDEFMEKSDLNGQTYLVQYFERAVFEYHPEFAGTPNEVLLSQLGTFQYRQKYGGK